ncbi:hypothetical protein LPJ64_006463, partial [Coemansia asiatica]
MLDKPISMDKMLTFGCRVVVPLPTELRPKLGTRVQECIYLGTADGKYIVMNVTTGRVLHTTQITQIDENVFPLANKSGSFPMRVFGSSHTKYPSSHHSTLRIPGLDKDCDEMADSSFSVEEEADSSYSAGEQQNEVLDTGIAENDTDEQQQQIADSAMADDVENGAVDGDTTDDSFLDNITARNRSTAVQHNNSAYTTPVRHNTAQLRQTPASVYHTPATYSTPARVSSAQTSAFNTPIQHRDVMPGSFSPFQTPETQAVDPYLQARYRRHRERIVQQSSANLPGTPQNQRVRQYLVDVRPDNVLSGEVRQARQQQPQYSEENVDEYTNLIGVADS